MKKLFILICSCSLIYSSKLSPIMVLSVVQTKYNAHAKLKITSPQVLKRDSPILVLVSNFPIGVDLTSQELDDKGVKKNKDGSRVLMMFSNGKRLYVTKDDVNMLLTQRSYFNKRFRVKVPTFIYKDIEEHNFLIYSMLVNCYGECIKNENASFTDVYCYGKEKKGMRMVKKDLKKPFLIYNEPYGKKDSSNVLLDFYVRNAIISPDEYKVDVFVDDKKVARLLKWQPYALQNLPKGKHDVRIELVDHDSKVVKNPISVNSATIYVK
jgi:hypothetical protein